MQCDNVTEARRHDVIANKGEGKRIIVGFAITGESRTSGEEEERDSGEIS